MGIWEEYLQWLSTWREIKSKFAEAKEFWWGDNLDARFYVCKQLKKIHNKKILELAAGPGVITSVIPQDNAVTSIEINQTAVEISRRLNNGKGHFNIMNGDMFKKKQYSGLGKFDLVLLVHGMPKSDYCSERNPKEIMDIIYELLKPGGEVIITTPNKENPYQNKKGKPYNTEDLRGIIRESYFEVQSERTWNRFIYLTHVAKFGFLAAVLLLLTERLGNDDGVALYARAKKILKRGEK